MASFPMAGTPPHYPQLALGSTILLQRLLQSLLRRVQGVQSARKPELRGIVPIYEH